MRAYTPRRANKTRWLAGAPEYVLDCLYYKRSDSYDVLFTGSLLGMIKGEPQDFAHVYVMGLDLSPSGAWASFELRAYEAARYRQANGHRRIAWSKLPEDVRKSVRDWAESGRTSNAKGEDCERSGDCDTAEVKRALHRDSD